MEAWLAQNVTFVIGGVAGSAVLTFIYRRFITKHIPVFMSGATTFLATTVSNLLGVSFGEGHDLVESIPLIKTMEKAVTQSQVANEALLIEYKRKILNPLYNKPETELYIRLFDALMARLDGTITEETLEIIQAFEDLYKEEE